MTQSLFVSEKWIKLNTVLPANMDVKELYPFYSITQDKYVRDVFGDELYDHLYDGNKDGSLTPDEKILLVKVRPMLAWYIIYEAMPFFANKIKNIGVVKTADDKQTNSDRADVKELTQKVQNNAEYYLVRLQNYLKDNKALYPQYKFNNPDVNPNTTSGYTCDLYIDPKFIDEKWIKKYWRE